MGTDIRPSVSKKNPYYIDKERYYELRHFCKQYDYWKKICAYIRAGSVPSVVCAREFGSSHANPTEKAVLLMETYSSRTDIIEKAAKQADEQLHDYILLAVTKGLSYPALRTQYSIPASKDLFYDRYRRFFFILNQLRN